MDVSDRNLPSQSVLKGCPTPGKPGPYCFGTLGRRNLVDLQVGSAPILLRPRLALPPPPPPSAQRPEKAPWFSFLMGKQRMLRVRKPVLSSTPR